MNLIHVLITYVTKIHFIQRVQINPEPTTTARGSSSGKRVVATRNIRHMGSEFTWDILFNSPTHL
jgi:hypothetical protein